MTKTNTNKVNKWLSYPEAKKIVCSLGIKTLDEWYQLCRVGKRPSGIPSKPHEYYKNKGWNGLLDFLGIVKEGFHPLEEAKMIIHPLGIKTMEEWRQLSKIGKLPKGLPSAPEEHYKDQGWKGYRDFLGTDYIPYEEAEQYARSSGIKSQREWKRLFTSGNLHKNISYNPDRFYKDKGWISWGKFLGTDRPSFEEARQYARSLGLKSRREWIRHCNKEGLPKGIPNIPNQYYKDKGWTDWPDFLGYEYTYPWTVEKVKQLLKDMIKYKVFDGMSDDERYHFLTSKGVLNLDSDNRFQQLFKNLAGLKNEEQLKALEDFANSDDENLPVLLSDEQLQVASTEDLIEQRENPLENEDIPSPQQMLKLSQSPVLESICQDVELMQYFVNSFTTKLWKRAFKDEVETVNEIRLEGNIDSEFHDAYREKFLSEYKAMENTEIPKGYASSKQPRVMQRYIASKIKTEPHFGNFSGTGAGKTLSAILASRVIDSKMTLVVCPNDVVVQWRDNIVEVFPDSKVITGKPAFYAKYDKNKHQYLVINYDKLSQEDSSNLVLNLVKERIEFVIIDEIQFVKTRDGSDESKRHNNLKGLMTEARKKNSNIKVLGMSATPVINDLREGISLLEIMTGKEYSDLSDKKTGPNAMALYQKLSTMSIREMPEFPSEIVMDFVEVSAEKSPNVTLAELLRNPLLMEQILTDARLPEIIKRIKGQTIIYTEYVTGIVPKIKECLEKAHYKFAEYTGDSKELSSFINKRVQVLIASKPISVGVDGLQNVCHNLIINTLPWTNAQFKQLIGRLHRVGQQNNKVHVHIIKASIGRTAYDEVMKWLRIENKRTLADAAVDGRFPKSILPTKEQMHKELLRWEERLKRNEISTFNRSNINLILTPTQKLEHVRQLSVLSILNKKINTQRSEKTHEGIQQHPEFLVDYHRKLDECKKDWTVQPINVIARKINDQQIPSHLIMRQVIGDFGCGKGELMELLKENKMYSFDHHNILNEKITPCDMKSVPMKDEKLDIAVFSLSLMATNWPDYIKEAKRCLRRYGLLFIAETTKQLNARLSELRNVIKEQGFEIYNEDIKGPFTFIDAKKL